MFIYIFLYTIAITVLFKDAMWEKLDVMLRAGMKTRAHDEDGYLSIL